MHIADGVLSLPVLLTGATLTVAGVTKGLQTLDYERIPQVAILSSTCFVASLIHLPLGPTSVHLVLNGLTGLLLGWAAFPAILIALFLQAVLFGFGGLIVLGVNTVNLALPAVLCFYLFNRLVITKTNNVAFFYGFVTGALAIVFSTIFIGLSLLITGSTFLQIIQLTFLAHLPVMLVEGIITGTIVVFLRQVRPELLTVPLLSTPQMETRHA